MDFGKESMHVRLVIIWCVCVCERERQREGRGENKGIWLQNWVTVWNTWLPVVKDEQHWGKGWTNKGPLEESLISAGRLMSKVSSVHTFSAGAGLPLPGQLSSAFQLLKRTEGAFTGSASVSPLERAGPPLPWHVNVYHFHPFHWASGAKETVSYWSVAVCVCVCDMHVRWLSFSVTITVPVRRWSQTPAAKKDEMNMEKMCIC